MTIYFDGEPLQAHAGETIGACLLAHGRLQLRKTRWQGAWRGMYCGIGVCYDCIVNVDGKPGVRACRTPVEEGMRVTSAALFEGREGGGGRTEP